jgi:hypothetical protein
MPNLTGDFSGGGESAPFNMAIDTLQRIANIIDKLSAVSSGMFVVENINQVKFNLLTQLFIQSVPLLKEADEAVIKQNLKELKAEIKPPKVVFDDSGNIKGREYIDNPNIEDKYPEKGARKFNQETSLGQACGKPVSQSWLCS